MPKIRILPEQLANQIAAGEVVERPASVVKELLENCLDAGADRIEVEIEGGGTRLIRIIDNGEGMDEDDVLLSLERHGTSKIQEGSDLAAITSLGFRGEAIPSIGSVSKMVITSRTGQSELGTRAEINYGKLVRVHEAGCSTGTIIEIKNLFGNTPARKKFLRTVRTELNHIDEVVKNYALAEPTVTFSLTVNGKRTLYLDGSQSLEQRLALLLHFDDPFLQVGSADSDKDKYAYGFLIPPEQLRNGPARMRFFVNGRAVKDRMMSHGVAEGLRGFLMKGKNPAGLLHLVLPPEEVDVNVHPAKHEVRFRNSRDVHFLISRTVSEAMQTEQKRLRQAIFGNNERIMRVPVDRNGPPENPFELQNEFNPGQQPPEQVPKQVPRHVASTTRGDSAEQLLYNNSQHPAEELQPLEHSGNTPMTAEPLPARLDEPKNVAQPVGQQPHPAPLPLSEVPNGHGLKVIGQLGDLYIFCQSENGMVVIDQHAVHERLLYEKLQAQFRNRSVASQQLLFPETVELTLFQMQLVEKHEEELSHMGFSLREFGGNSYIISAVPAIISRSNPSELLMDVLEQFGSESTHRDSGEIIDTILSTMACRAAVKAGTSLSVREIEALLDKMAEADLFSHCPHGRPVVKQFTMNEIKKWFHRT